MSSAIVWIESSVLATRDVTPSVREFTLATTSPSRPYAAGSHLQVELLRRYRQRSEGDPQVERVRRGIHLSINGLAAGLKSSG